MDIERCPRCGNHCSKDNLGCGRGREYFENQNVEDKPKSLTENVVMELKRCGHLLHHNRNLDANELLSNLNEEELRKLHELLSKRECKIKCVS